jgi:CBS domain-containing protein
MVQRNVGQLIKRGVVHLSAAASVREACELMATNHVGAVLVMEEGRLDGIFTERDALNRVLAARLDPDTTRIADVMTREPITLSPQTPVTEALRLMSEIGFRHLPIVDQEEVQGIISLRDFVGVELQLAATEDDEEAS